LQVSVAEIRAAVKLMEKIDRDVESLRDKVPTKSAHLEMRADVDRLMQQNIGAQDTWNLMATRMPILWDDHIKSRGKADANRAWLVVISTAVLILSGAVALQQLGFSVVHHG